AGSLLAMRAMAGAQLRHGSVDGVADRAAEADAGERGGHKFILCRLLAAGYFSPNMAVMAAERAELAVLFEHPEWQKPLFEALERRNVRYPAVDLKKAAFSDADSPLAPLYFNQASPSAYVRGNTRAVPY